ncbi:transcription factor Cys6 [Rasamsonia emersonii CBS 393.64]|uniref:Transcription factor Cys6 n=1 Tax=Rasamsonia emersonii (strain ATCC 16479 / CBS 393.64 / IMI 116815) TaxID=1408163 RepID=A0A0F4YYC9_RASE3|nr:transcription factor Cys6 [Rasamsonia emersonii CBS 393.64]KKA23239.1 transcription factor Cys6 [Rasamsonia emersonii CBS 393.64]
MSSEKQVHSWSTHDLACTHCREKKIRCGRERPQCASCKRDGLECGYSTPRKRVNHIKLLCHSFGGLEDRLSNIEGELSRLTAILRVNGGRGSSFLDPTTDEDEMVNTTAAEAKFTDETPCRIVTDRHIVRSQGDLIDRYHGPCTLFALCKEFCDTILSERQIHCSPSSQSQPQQGEMHDGVARNEELKGLLTRLCLEAQIEETFDLPPGYNPVRLPPKQFLLMAQTQFFQQSDYTTDIFVQSNFLSNVERIYSRPFAPADEAWAICFNVVILLVLGFENPNHGSNDSLMGSQFVRPFLLTVRMALSNPRILMAPKLINVQALALLACVLVRTIGLHQMHAASNGVSQEEAEERFKVLRSLYLLDKSCAISRGSICWLPSFDCGISSVLSQPAFSDPTYAARMELAMLQEEIYRLFHSAESQKQSVAEHKIALARVDQRLERWANAHDIYSSSHLVGQDIDLKLDYFAARITAFHGSPDPGHLRRALNDARASCLLLLTSLDEHNPAMVEWLEGLLLSMHSLKFVDRKLGQQQDKNTQDHADFAAAKNEKAHEPGPSHFHRLLSSFPVPAFFLMAKNIVGSISGDNQAQAEGDLNLLQMVCACFKGLDSRIPADNYTRRVGRAFERLLEIIHLIINPQTSSLETQDSFHSQGTPSTQSLVAGVPNLTDFGDLTSPTGAVPAVTVSWDGFTNKSTTVTTNTNQIDTPGTITPPSLLTPVDMSYLTQPADALRQQSYPSRAPRRPMGPPSRKRRHLSDEDVVSMDSQSETFLFDLLASNPDMSFDIQS